jgi:hypothetical protein
LLIAPNGIQIRAVTAPAHADFFEMFARKFELTFGPMKIDAERSSQAAPAGFGIA